jgi:hypothetical protein
MTLKDRYYTHILACLHAESRRTVYFLLSTHTHTHTHTHTEGRIKCLGILSKGCSEGWMVQLLLPNKKIWGGWIVVRIPRPMDCTTSEFALRNEISEKKTSSYHLVSFIFVNKDFQSQCSCFLHQYYIFFLKFGRFPMQRGLLYRIKRELRGIHQ